MHLEFTHSAGFDNDFFNYKVSLNAGYSDIKDNAWTICFNPGIPGPGGVSPMTGNARKRILNNTSESYARLTAKTSRGSVNMYAAVVRSLKKDISVQMHWMPGGEPSTAEKQKAVIGVFHIGKNNTNIISLKNRLTSAVTFMESTGNPVDGMNTLDCPYNQIYEADGSNFNINPSISRVYLNADQYYLIVYIDTIHRYSQPASIPAFVFYFNDVNTIDEIPRRYPSDMWMTHLDTDIPVAPQGETRRVIRRTSSSNNIDNAYTVESKGTLIVSLYANTEATKDGICFTRDPSVPGPINNISSAIYKGYDFYSRMNDKNISVSGERVGGVFAYHNTESISKTLYPAFVCDGTYLMHDSMNVGYSICGYTAKKELPNVWAYHREADKTAFFAITVNRHNLRTYKSFGIQRGKTYKIEMHTVSETGFDGIVISQSSNVTTYNTAQTITPESKCSGVNINKTITYTPTSDMNIYIHFITDNTTLINGYACGDVKITATGATVTWDLNPGEISMNFMFDGEFIGGVSSVTKTYSYASNNRYIVFPTAGRGLNFDPDRILKGWCVNSNGTGAIYKAGDKISFFDINTKYYAIWEPLRPVLNISNPPKFYTHRTTQTNAVVPVKASGEPVAGATYGNSCSSRLYNVVFTSIYTDNLDHKRTCEIHLNTLNDSKMQCVVKLGGNAWSPAQDYLSAPKMPVWDGSKNDFEVMTPFGTITVTLMALGNANKNHGSKNPNTSIPSFPSKGTVGSFITRLSDCSTYSVSIKMPDETRIVYGDPSVVGSGHPSHDYSPTCMGYCMYIYNDQANGEYLHISRNKAEHDGVVMQRRELGGGLDLIHPDAIAENVIHFTCVSPLYQQANGVESGRIDMPDEPKMIFEKWIPTATVRYTSGSEKPAEQDRLVFNAIIPDEDGYGYLDSPADIEFWPPAAGHPDVPEVYGIEHDPTKTYELKGVYVILHQTESDPGLYITLDPINIPVYAPVLNKKDGVWEKVKGLYYKQNNTWVPFTISFTSPDNYTASPAPIDTILKTSEKYNVVRR